MINRKKFEFSFLLGGCLLILASCSTALVQSTYEEGEHKATEEQVAETPALPIVPTPIEEEVKAIEPSPREHAQSLVDILNSQLRFGVAKTELPSEALPSLQELAKLMVANPTLKVELTGHTDTSGKAALNKKLSQKRVETVKKALIASGANQTQVNATAFGSAKPAASNKDADGRSFNRRVEVSLQ